MVHEMVAIENTEKWLSENYKKVGNHLYVNSNVEIEVAEKNKISGDEELGEEEKDDVGNKNTQIVFLMGGSGTRLLHVTKDQFSKHMIGIGDHPLSRYVFDLWRNSGFKNFAFLVDNSQKGNSIREHYGNGEKFGVEIKYSVEDRKLGSGGALRLAIENKTITGGFVNHFPDDPIVGYENFPEDFFKIIQAADENGYDAVIVCVPGAPYPYGEVIDKDGRVVDFVEKPFINKDSNIGIFWLSEKTLPLLKKLEPNKEIKIERTVLKEIAQSGKMLKVLLPSEMWIPVNDDPNLKKFEEIINK